MLHYSKIVIFLFSLLNFYSSLGQNFFAEVREIGMEEGLSHYKVLDFYPEKNGMWIGTDEGLNFYNGYQWQYWSKDKGHLTRREVNFIHKDQDDCLWLFNTKKIDERKRVLSIDILNSNRDSVFSFYEKFGSQAPFQLKDIQNFFEDQSHQIFFLINNTLWKYTSNHSFEIVTLPQKFKPYSILSDDYLVGSMDGKLSLVSPQGDLIYTSNFLLNDYLFNIIGTRQKFWVWQNKSPVKVFEQINNNQYRSTLFPLQQDNQTFYFLFFDQNKNQIWVNKDDHIYLFDEYGNQLLKQETMARVANLDKDGNLWTGKFNATLLRVKERKFKRFLYLDPRTNKKLVQCRGIFKQGENLFVNTYEGLKIINLKSEKVKEPLPETKINFGFIKDHDGYLWTAYRNIFQINPSDNQILKSYMKIDEDPRIWSLFEDIDHRIWVGKKGLAVIENGTLHEFDNYNEFEELAEAIILFFFKDKNGVIWVGSDNGLFQLDPKKGIISKYGKSRDGGFYLPSSKFQHMYQDEQGIFWLATEDAGLVRWNKATGKIDQYGKSHGFLTNNIYAVYEDDFDNLWLSSFNGIIRFQKETQKFIIYNEEDGVSNNEFNRISHFQAKDGSIYFGTQNGVTSFHPKNFQIEKEAEKEFNLALNQVSIFGKNALSDQMADGTTIDLMNLGPGIRVIDFEILSPNLFWTDKIDLHYTLKSIDENQKQQPTFKEKISSDHHVELFGMHPGAYELSVKAIQKNGKQLGETLTIPMKINQPIFHQPIFWVFILLSFVLSIWGLIKLRTTHLKRRQIELEKLVKERTEQIFKDQKIIQTQTEQIEAMKERLDHKDELWLAQFQNIIKERIDDPDLYLPDIIEKMEISRSIFYEKVKSLTQMTPNQYIQELRLSKAKNILERGEMKTVKEVAFCVGIKRPSYFSKLYKERFGIVPSAYFNSHKN